MTPIENHSYLKICGELANHLSISLASARRQVDIHAAKQGLRDSASKMAIAKNMLDDLKMKRNSDEDPPAKTLDKLLEALAADENFMVED